MPTFPPESIEKALLAAERAGVTRAAVLDAAGLGSTGGVAPLRYDALCAIYEAAARLTGDAAFGLHVGERTSPRMYGMLGYVAANSGGFGDALDSIVEFQRLWSDAAGFDLVRDRGVVRITYWHLGKLPAEKRRHESEQMLATLLVFARGALAAPVQPLEVRFEHRAPSDLAEHQRLFGCPVIFKGRATEIVLPARLLLLSMPQADPALGILMKGQAGAALARQFRHEPFVARLDALVRAAIEGSRAISVGTLAAGLGMGPRSLQRRLQERGLTFRTVVEGARIGLAKRLLEDSGLALGQIAHRLGYSQPSAFHRAFSRHTGTTPQSFRRALQIGGHAVEPLRNARDGG